MESQNRIFKSNILEITPYEPGKPISEVQREYGLTDVVKLASNENPLGPSPKSVEAVNRALQDLHRYPDGGGYYLKQKLSERFGFDTSQIVLGNGSAEIVELITEAFIGETDEAIIGKQAFFKYRIAVQIMNGRSVWAEMPELTHNVDEILKKISSKTKLIFIANPNNPTGTLMDKIQVGRLMDAVPENIITIFDEAYYDYRDPEIYPECADYIKEGRNVIILRTFSKSYGLAGLRIGYAFTTEKIAKSMNRVREAFNVNSLALIGGEAALDDDEHLQNGLIVNTQGKQFFIEKLKELDIEYVPTEANFILVKVPMPGRELFARLLHKGVVVRPVDGYGLPDYIRVSIGLSEENEKFFSALEEVL